MGGHGVGGRVRHGRRRRDHPRRQGHEPDHAAVGAPADPRGSRTTRCRRSPSARRLGIPLTISTDPRHHFQYDARRERRRRRVLAVARDRSASRRIGDAALVRRFADIARQEYRAVGIHDGALAAGGPRRPSRAGRASPAPSARTRTLARELVQRLRRGIPARRGRRRPRRRRCRRQALGRLRRGASTGSTATTTTGRSRVPDAALDLHVRPFVGAFAAKVARRDADLHHPRRACRSTGARSSRSAAASIASC